MYIFNFVETFQKARKIAEDETYTSAEDFQLGKGYRKKIPSSRFVNHTDSISDESIEDNNNKADNSVNVQSTKRSYKKKYCKNVHVDTIDTQENNNNNTGIKRHAASKLPKWPSSTVNSRNENTCHVPKNGINILENSKYICYI